MNQTIHLYTDGACSGNPGPGGYGAILKLPEGEQELSGGYQHTTNNRMELMAVIKGLEALPISSQVVVYSDSKYVIDAITLGWAKKWQARNWIKPDKKPALNPDLWQTLLALCAYHRVTFVWVRGHSGHPENERCDRLAVAASHQRNLQADDISLPIAEPTIAKQGNLIADPVSLPNVDQPWIYLAGPLFTQAETTFNQHLAEQLRVAGCSVYLPQQACAGVTQPQALYDICITGLKGANLVLVILDGTDADSGSCFEMGYAYAKGLPIVGLRTDFRGSGEHLGLNLMLTHSCKHLLLTTLDATAINTKHVTYLTMGEDFLPKLLLILKQLVRL